MKGQGLNGMTSLGLGQERRTRAHSLVCLTCHERDLTNAI
jgi:hypothetical protein